MAAADHGERLDLSTLLAETAEFVAGIAPAPLKPLGRDLAYELRTRLAVRGWVNPHDVLNEQDSEAEIGAALSAVAEEVDSLFSHRQGKWYMSVQHRLRVLASRGADAVARELAVERYSADGDDPVRQALAIVIGQQTAPPLEELREDVLRAMPGAMRWMEYDFRLSVDEDAIRAEIERRVLSGDLQHLTKLPLVGRVHRSALGELIAMASKVSPEPLLVSYIYGAGGSGKSTLLAFVERGLLELPSSPMVARIDFDSAGVSALDPVSLDIALCEQLSLRVPAVRAALEPAVAQLRATRRERGLVPESSQGASPMESLAMESAFTQSDSIRDSILYGVLDFASGASPDRPLVVILDTAEVAMSFGSAAAVEVARWAASLPTILGASSTRLIVAGRDAPAELGGGDLVDHLGRAASPITIIPLPELERNEAAQLLGNYGVIDEAVALAAAEAVPCNPLLLRITAEALQADDELAEEVRSAHRRREVDRGSSRHYLARRIVAHLADPVARPYVLPAMYLPSITRNQLAAIVIPEVDGNDPHSGNGIASYRLSRKVDRVFKALRSARWLSKPGLTSRQFDIQRDVRSLSRWLLAADPDERERERSLRTRAVAVHQSRRGSEDRAYAVYHRVLLGEKLAPLLKPGNIVRHLREVIDDLPQTARDQLRNTPQAKQGAASINRDLDDDEWRIYLEGAGAQDGQGMRLLRRDRGIEALELYRLRPTRRAGAPPTFVIRALADLALWDTKEIDADAVLDESSDWLKSKRLSGAALSRLYWITRFALQHDSGILSERHAVILKDCCARMPSNAMSTLQAIVAVAEAQLRRCILPDRMIRQRGAVESVTRLHLVRSGLEGRGVTIKPHVDAVAVTQRDWVARLRKEASGAINAASLDWVQKSLDDLHDRPVAMMSPLFKQLRRPISVTWSGKDRQVGVLLLRGETIEFHRPLRRALVMLHEDETTTGLLPGILSEVVARLSIRPSELSPDGLADRFHRSGAAWAAAFVAYVDRCRLLPFLCSALVRIEADPPAAATARRVAESFLVWDRAICGEGLSGWTT